MVRYLAALALLLAAAGRVAADGGNLGELVDQTTLRVCADPSNLPFSNDAGEGFENKIAELLATELGVELAYSWHPQSIGFVRNTLGARTCDVVMGVVTTSELMQNTNPYYHSSYALIQRADDEPEITSLRDPALADLQIGAVARTPPVTILAQQALLANLTPYHLMVDTRVHSPGRQMVEDLAAAKIDVGVLWGPIAGYWAAKQEVPIQVTPLVGEDRGVRMDFRISMGLRRNEPLWKGTLNDFLAARQGEIEAILAEYGVPFLDQQGQPIEPAAAEPLAVGDDREQGNLEDWVPEPDGYRLAEYRAPVPAALEGATTVDTAELQRLIAEQAPVLIDVLPAPREPKNRPANRIWRPKPRDNLPGSAWLANVGYGELSREFEAYFQEHLGRLSGGDRSRLLVFYCQADCWMSWNAAKRALAHGYDNVAWYPGGTDAWEAAGLPLERAEPVEMPDFVPIDARPGDAGAAESG